jgi:hypothetical protein
MRLPSTSPQTSIGRAKFNMEIGGPWKIRASLSIVRQKTIGDFCSETFLFLTVMGHELQARSLQIIQAATRSIW